MDAFGKLRGKVGHFLEQRKIQHEIAECEAKIATNPNDMTPLLRLADICVDVGRTEEAIAHYSTAADLARNEKKYETSLALFRKAERLATAERRVQILRRMIPVACEARLYPQAFQHAREVVEYYIANGQLEVASGFLKQVPELGPKDSAFRNQLGNLIGGRVGTWSATDDAKGSWQSGASAKAPVREDFSSLAVLLVDDEPAQLKLYARALEALGCELMFGGDGSEGLQRVSERRPALIIADLVMPKMDGAEFYDSLQNNPATEAIPFVCLSAQNEEVELVSALERGVEDYWTKPIRPKELRARVKRILRRIKDYSALSGSLAEMPIPDLLQMLEQNTRTGSLLLESGGRSAVIYFIDGRPVDAVTEGREGEAAVFATIEWNDGRFAFSPRLPDRPQRIFTSTQGLLLEAMRRYDEEHAAVASLPDNHDTRLVLLPGLLNEADLPPDCTVADLERVRGLLDGKRTLGMVVAELKGLLSSIKLLASLYEHGRLGDLGPPPIELKGVVNAAVNAAFAELVEESRRERAYGAQPAPTERRFSSETAAKEREIGPEDLLLGNDLFKFDR